MAAAFYIYTMKPFRKKSTVAKLLLKSKNSEAYKNYKFQLALSKIREHTHFDIPEKEAYHFKHSGNAGDIIYSLPATFALAGSSAIHYHLVLNAPGGYGKNPHPLGNVMLNEKMARMLQPLLLAQHGIASCPVYDAAQPIDFDLDLIRTYPFPLSRGNIARWYFYIFAVNADLGKPWLQATPDNGMSGHIVIARSQRYRSPNIHYGFLKKYAKTVFVGVEAEWQEMRQMLPQIEYRPVNDFLELAQIIAGSRLFIGNQSFPFSIAEGLKVKRLLEVYHLSPNVNVEGATGYDFCFQPQFEKLVAKLYEQI